MAVLFTHPQSDIHNLHAQATQSVTPQLYHVEDLVADRHAVRISCCNTGKKGVALLPAGHDREHCQNLIAQGARALVVAASIKGREYLCVLNFFAPDHTTLRARKTTHHADAIKLGRGDDTATLEVKNGTLHIVAKNILAKARAVHRIVGGSVHIG